MFDLPNQFFSRHKGIAAWVWHDAICRFAKPVVKNVLASMTSLGCQVAAFGIVFLFAKALEQNKIFSLFGHAFNSRSAGVIIFVGLSAFFFFIVSALLAYFAAVNSIQLRRNYGEFCFKRVLVFASRLPHPTTKKANQMLARDELKGGLKVEADYCGRFLRQLVEIILPAGSLVAYSVVLFSLSLFLSMVIFPIIIVSSIFLQKINSAAAQTSRDLKLYTKQASLKRRILLNRMSSSASPIEYSDRLMNDFFSNGKTRHYFDAFFRRFILSEKTRLVVNILMSASVLGVIIAAATGVMSKNWNWSVVFGYLVALRAFSSSLSHLSGGVTLISRFFPHVEAYYRFISDAQQVDIDVASWTGGDAVHLKVPSIMNGLETVVLEPNRPIFLLNPRPVDRILASQFQIKTIHEDADKATRYWFAEKMNCQGSTLRECLGLPRSLTESEIKKKLADLFSNKTLNEILPVSLDVPLGEGQQKEIPSYALSAMRLFAGVYSNHQVILLSGRDLALVNRIFPKSLRDIMSDRILIWSCSKPPRASAENEESLVLIANGKELVGWCLLGWLERNPEVLQTLFPGINRKQNRTEVFSPDEEDE